MNANVVDIRDGRHCPQMMTDGWLYWIIIRRVERSTCWSSTWSSNCVHFLVFSLHFLCSFHETLSSMCRQWRVPLTTRCRTLHGTGPFVVRLCLDIVINVYPLLLQIFVLQEISIPVRHRCLYVCSRHCLSCWRCELSLSVGLLISCMKLPFNGRRTSQREEHHITLLVSFLVFS